MKTKIGIIMMTTALIMLITNIYQAIMANYLYTKNYLYAWNLADKSSTINAKALYVSQFVSSIESNKHDFAQYNAQFLFTKDNSLQYNIEALKTLNNRLNQIMSMDIKSFEYQTAIQQITQLKICSIRTVIRG
jgi:hypothetical protein